MSVPRSPHILTLVSLSAMSALSINLFLPSLTGMARYFGVDYAVMQFAVSGYLAASALAQLVIAPVSDRFGRRPLMLAVLAIFAVATFWSMVAETAAAFLVARMFQAVIAAAVPLGRAAVRDVMPGPEAASRIGYITMGMALAPMLGPMIGGALDEAFGWRASIGFLFALSCAALVIAWCDMTETVVVRQSSFRAQFAAYPALLRSQRFWGYALAAALGSGGFFAYVGGAPFVGSVVFGLSPGQVGMFFAFPALGYAVGNFLSGRFAIRLGMDRAVLIGAVLCSLPMAVALAVDLAGAMHPAVFFPAVGVMALGNGMLLPSATAGTMSVRPELAGSAAGLGGMMAIGTGAALAALAGAMLHDDTGATPLIGLMLTSSLLAIPSILWVRHRARRLGL
ncbi:multidrug effflux MFS transporter [Frigidibacter sp. MR17.24]|uniref:multidrug effflux MFS transporter n=1 Tax=Frigidibacter sp. MR17.24 TaxID=3127345 RepID=UPI003012A810